MYKFYVRLAFLYSNERILNSESLDVVDLMLSGLMVVENFGLYTVSFHVSYEGILWCLWELRNLDFELLDGFLICYSHKVTVYTVKFRIKVLNNLIYLINILCYS